MTQVTLDDQIRPSWGLGIFVRIVDGRVRIILDDLQRMQNKTGSHPQWEMWAFFTHCDVTSLSSTMGDLSKEDYEALGRTVIARLAAHLSVQGDAETALIDRGPSG
jgi:hypothetical protein